MKMGLQGHCQQCKQTWGIAGWDEAELTTACPYCGKEWSTQPQRPMPECPSCKSLREELAQARADARKTREAATQLDTWKRDAEAQVTELTQQLHYAQAIGLQAGAERDKAEARLEQAERALAAAVKDEVTYLTCECAACDALRDHEARAVGDSG